MKFISPSIKDLQEKDQDGRSFYIYAHLGGSKEMVLYIKNLFSENKLKLVISHAFKQEIYCNAVEREHNDILNLESIKSCEVDPFIVLIYACQGGRLEFVQKALNPEIDVNKVDANGQTLLMHACMGENLEIVKLVIEKQVNINATDSLGTTALMLACMTNVNIVQELIRHKADASVKNKLGFTAQDIALIVDELRKESVLLPIVDSNYHRVWDSLQPEVKKRQIASLNEKMKEAIGKYRVLDDQSNLSLPFKVLSDQIESMLLA
jgi:ankyrin repeat protein